MNDGGRALPLLGGQLRDADDGRFAAQARHGAPRCGSATVAVPGISTSSPRLQKMSRSTRPSVALAGDHAAERQLLAGMSDRAVLHRERHQPPVAADPVRQRARQQRRLQRALHEHVVIALDVAGPLLVVVDAVTVVGRGAEEEHLRLVHGDRQHRDRVAGVDVLVVHLLASCVGRAIIDVVASASSSRCWLRYSAAPGHQHESA